MPTKPAAKKPVVAKKPTTKRCKSCRKTMKAKEKVCLHCMRVQ